MVPAAFARVRQHRQVGELQTGFRITGASARHPNSSRQPIHCPKGCTGAELFFDPRLSRGEQISCATCHEPDKGFSNGQRLAKGVDGRMGSRHVPSLINVGYSTPLFWDGRATSLEEQALLPIQSPAEMDKPLNQLIDWLNADAPYRELFQRAFHGNATSERIGQSLAAYQRTIVSNRTPFDLYLDGNRDALSSSAQNGMRLFFGRARCSVCHQGSRLTDNRFHNIGTADPALPEDTGRRAVTQKDSDHGRFRTPQLREIGRTAPYMHNGKFKTLQQVVEHYNFGGVTDEANDHRDEQLEVLYLSEDEVTDLVTFLSAGLTSQTASPEEGTSSFNARPQAPAACGSRLSTGKPAPAGGR